MISEQHYKIVYLSPALYSAGGVERVVSLKASYFADVFGYDVTVIVTEGKGQQSFFTLSPKVKVINLNIGFEELWHASFIKKIWLYLQKQRRYRRLLTAELMRIRPDFTISVLRREINFLNRIPDGSFKIGELHVSRTYYRDFKGIKPESFRKLLANYWMRGLVRQLRKLDKFVVLSDKDVSDWPELDNVTVIPDPLPFKSDVVSSLTSKRLVTIGRYAHQKGYDLLLRAWASVSKECPDWSLDIYGAGDRMPYQQLMNELCIDPSRCRLNGSLSDVRSVYLESSLFVLPSRFEGFGMVIVEAMSCGLPVVSFDCENGPRSIISDGEDGLLVKAEDVEALAESLVSLMQDDDRRRLMGDNARKKSFSYDQDFIAGQWKHLFNELKAEK